MQSSNYIKTFYYGTTTFKIKFIMTKSMVKLCNLIGNKKISINNKLGLAFYFTLFFFKER